MKKKFQHDLKASKQQILEKLDKISNNPLATKKDVADLLERNLQALCIKLYVNTDDLYEISKIQKKNGKERIIFKPNPYLKQVQRNLLYILNLKYESKFCSHGFEKDKSIKTNAATHVSKKYILKCDIENFFPTINFKRVYGVFKSPPYNFNPEIATFLAHICIYQVSTTDKHDLGILPQGAPTSPLIANLVCRTLDNQLFKLAKNNKCYYTRYADDMYFSTYLTNFPEKLYTNGKLSNEIEEIIYNNDFRINYDKTKLMYNNQRQAVTGIITNKKLNVKRSYIKNTRTMLYLWEKFKNKYTLQLFNATSEKYTVLHLLSLCKSLIFFPSKSEFKKYHTLNVTEQEDLVQKYLNDDNKRKNMYYAIATELSLYEAEQLMHEKLYKNKVKKPFFKNVLRGKIGYIKLIRGEDDNLYRKLWNRYCKIINSNQFKPLIYPNTPDNRIYNMLHSVKEGLDVEFKEYYDKKKLLETVNSFLNSDKGGQLIFGINDITMEITGIDKEINKQQKGEDGLRTMITNIICSKFHPTSQLNITCKFHKIYNKTICRIEVQPYHNKPIYYEPGKYYIRQDGRKQLVQT